MSLKLTYTDKKTGEVKTDSYHRICFGFKDLAKKYLQIFIKIYANEAAYSEGKEVVDIEKINVTEADFDKYFSTTEIDKTGNNLEKKAYELLKTIDPEEENSLYTDCRFDYKNDSTDV